MAFNLDLSPSHEALLGQLAEMCDLKTKKEVIENALTIFGWAAVQSSKGLSIASVDDAHKIYREILTPALTSAALKKKVPQHA